MLAQLLLGPVGAAAVLRKRLAVAVAFEAGRAVAAFIRPATHGAIPIKQQALEVQIAGGFCQDHLVRHRGGFEICRGCFHGLKGAEFPVRHVLVRCASFVCGGADEDDLICHLSGRAVGCRGSGLCS